MRVYVMYFLMAAIFAMVVVYMFVMASQLDETDDQQKFWKNLNFGMGGLASALFILFMWLGSLWVRKYNQGKIKQVVTRDATGHTQVTTTTGGDAATVATAPTVVPPSTGGGPQINHYHYA